ncbi:hypothetical protein [Flammeovirga pacifica]|uniref:T9SS C-terminal target domain-containing protein n=1 Tax=Flammeovirga pacifica TaxID=915059 RepID=A0A1S1Z1K1_FLAPC|nr:hypothetical protein [Flammeovirga pacifica]OHX66985.1 hypothetical protein NH26_11830 [Flammeovirga pacifica]
MNFNKSISNLLQIILLLLSNLIFAGNNFDFVNIKTGSYTFSKNVKLKLDGATGRVDIYMKNNTVAELGDINNHNLHLVIHGRARLTGQNFAGSNNFIGIDGKLYLSAKKININGVSDSLAVSQTIISPDNGRIEFNFNVQNQKKNSPFAYSFPKNYDKQKIKFTPALVYNGELKAVSFTSEPLPVKMIYVKYDKKKNQLKWETATEINNDHFTVEYSDDKINWYEYKTVKGVGNSKVKNDYKLILNENRMHKFYRLKQVDFNNDFQVFTPIATNLPQDIEIQSSHGEIYVSGDYQNVVLAVYSEQGKLIVNNTIQQHQKVEVPKNKILIVCVNDGAHSIRKKMILQ